LQEARTAANLEGHPNIVRIVDIGESQGVYYLIMQFIEGEDLNSYLDRAGRLTPQETVYVMAQVADALAWAHKHGVVHRDLKPANVRLDRAGRIMVLDFGIAKVGSVASTLTRMGFKLGTPHYMAPEQIQGRQIDHRADLYALGVMGFQLVTGQRPFKGQSHEAIWHAHVYEKPPSPLEIDPSIPRPLGDVILKLMEKDPASRFQSAGEVYQLLKALGGDQAPAKMRPEVGLDLSKWRDSGDSLIATGFTARHQDEAELSATMPASAPPPVAEKKAPARPGTPPAAPAEAPQPAGRKMSPRVLALIAAAVAVVAGALLTAFLYLDIGGETTGPVPAGPPQPQRLETPTGEMVLVPGGEFVYGHSSPQSPHPQQTVTLGSFYMDITEVSNEHYKAFCDATGREYPPPPSWSENYFENQPDYPVVNVTWEDARAFAEWAGKRLPTEQEWEKAARGMEGLTYSWGETAPSSGGNVQGAGDGYEQAAPVRSFEAGASPFGILNLSNLSGNVWEWTASRFNPKPDDVKAMKEFLKEFSPDWYVIKGDCFAASPDDPYSALQAYMHSGFPKDIKSETLGFRCVKDPPERPAPTSAASVE